ncbi:type I-E CRISPR-associated protein Cse2/CasB [Streptomyces sp. AN091965]|nr:type I-E CRISPR-associated protein Cse2/CasB [Streptomyces sp. AN091965]MCI3930526.1 type I-E CRISPR-associated protein Cse2/CasB [Streptomyces sp. AN091965]
MARLRREVGRDPHGSPTSWGLDDLEALTRLRERAAREREDGTPEPLSYPERRWREEREDREDRAVHLAVTLWALHQQSLRDEAMHVPRWALGRAARRLSEGKAGTKDRDDKENPGSGSAQDEAVRSRTVPDTELNPAVRKRFVRIGSSTDFETLAVRLREMVLLLRSARIPLDYGLLADQLDRWQQSTFQADVRREWGRGFHRVYDPSATAADERNAPGPSAEGLDLTAADAGE